MDANKPAGIGQQVRAGAQCRPDQPAVIDAEFRLTWAELDRAVTRAALALLAAGANSGDRVALELGTAIPFAILYLGALRAGLVAVPLNPAYTRPEIEHILRDSGAALHITAATAGDLLASAPEGVDPRADRGGEDVSVLLYTSGTSGRPRGAMLSARALLANVEQLAAIEPPVLRADDVVFVPLPLCHVFGLNAGLGMALWVGATAVLADRFDAAATLATMAIERVSAVLGVPGQYAQWLRQPGLADGFASVRFAMSGSATLPAAVVEGYAELGVVLHDGYGLTEAAPVVTINAIGAAKPKPGSIGMALPGIETELRDADGELTGPDDPGRLFVRGANLFSGYWPDGVDGPDAQGWFGTGDIAVTDEDGELHLVGRSAELVLVNGFNVYPAEVEAVLAAQPGVAEVAVVGVPDEASGAVVHAFVVPMMTADLDAGVLLAAAAGSLARFKLPREIEIVAELPRTVTGKIMKWQLRAAERADGAR
ncbi:MAG: AMP-dependent synthetase [Pseudonocardiales bacterium]|nr:MAG: AMP-dependent synthetase [Pseudonocardiales bacterium]